MSKRRRWTAAERAALCARYADESSAALAAEFERPVRQIYQAAHRWGLAKSAAYLASPFACRLRRGDNVGWAHRFRKGNVPANKGKKGWQAGGRSVETQFKRGQISKRWDPEIYCVGALRIDSQGYLCIKVRPGSRSWVLLHHYVWQQAHGPIPPGHVVSARDGDLMNTQPDNLYLRSRVDLMRANSVHNLAKPLAQAILLAGALRRQINQREHSSA